VAAIIRPSFPAFDSAFAGQARTLAGAACGLARFLVPETQASGYYELSIAFRVSSRTADRMHSLTQRIHPAAPLSISCGERARCRPQRRPMAMKKNEESIGLRFRSKVLIISEEVPTSFIVAMKASEVKQVTVTAGSSEKPVSKEIE